MQKEPTQPQIDSVVPAQPAAPIASANAKSIFGTKKRLYAKPIFWLAVVLVLALLGGGYYYWFHKHLSPAERLKKYSYSYSNSKLEQFKLPGSKASQGISFNKPVEFVPVYNLKPTAIYAELADYYKASKAIFIGDINVASVDASASPPTPASLQKLSFAITTPLVKNKAFAVAPIQNFVKARLTQYNVVFSQMNYLVTTNLKANAWYGSFTATPKSDKQNFNPLQGYIVFGAGKNTYYYFYITANQSNWQANNTVWPKILNSLKIDQ